MKSIMQRVMDVQIRQQRQWLWQCASAGLLAGGVAGTFIALIRIFTDEAFSFIWVVAAVIAPVFVAAGAAVVNSCSMLRAARTIDSQCGLKDRIETALQFLGTTAGNSPLQRIQIQDASDHLQSVDPVKVAPIHAPESWGWGILTTVIACLLCFFAGQSELKSAATEANPVVLAQADRAASDIAELEQFQQELRDPELEKTLAELAIQLTQLKEPGLAPEEALATLSEMESALREMQRQIAETSIEAQLREVGEALSLADAMTAAGQAMVAGEMEKAAEELSKLELPDLDRSTEKAINEKLQQIQNSAREDRLKQSLKDSLKKAAEGMSSGDRNKFQDGMKGLAGECRTQGRKKELSDLLKKQCQSLSECKSECESEIRSQAQSNKKGGKDAGQGSTDLNGEKTGKQKTGSELKLTGENSGIGDSDVESEKGPEQEQNAVRQYRQNADKYEAMSESVLESESIPLGQRQTIRRYFEMIRPNSSETDAVKKETDDR